MLNRRLNSIYRFDYSLFDPFFILGHVRRLRAKSGFDAACCVGWEGCTGPHSSWKSAHSDGAQPADFRRSAESGCTLL